MIRIPLSKGLVAIVDDEDARFANFKWSAFSARDRIYAMRSTRDRRAGTQAHFYLHREIVGAGPGFDVDHVNGDTLDNRRANLRIASRSQNLQNQTKRRDNRSGFKGVTRIPRARPWWARIKVIGHTHSLGCFSTAEEAARAYDAAARQHFGQFARVNFPGPGERGCRAA